MRHKFEHFTSTPVVKVEVVKVAVVKVAVVNANVKRILNLMKDKLFFKNVKWNINGLLTVRKSH